MKILRPSVMRPSEWYKERDQEQWKRTRQQVLQRDHFTCSYCTLVCSKFMQVNHLGAEDNHELENLETVCPACHSVLHLGINTMQGYLSVFECLPEVTNMAAIVCVTRSLVAKKTPWDEIERQVLSRFARPGGKHYSANESVDWASHMVASIQPSEFRGYLPNGLAVLFHEAGEWNGYSEAVWKWQDLPGRGYRKMVPANRDEGINDLPYHAKIYPFNAKEFYANSRIKDISCVICDKELGEDAFDVSIPHQKIQGFWISSYGAECCSEEHARQWIDKKIADWSTGHENEKTDGKPSECTDAHWIYAFLDDKDYVDETRRSGKWLVFLRSEIVDECWERIAKATAQGKLSTHAKVLTARDKKAKAGEKAYVVCVYTYDYNDKADVMRVREVLRDLGIRQTIPYKRDEDTQRLLYGSSYKPLYRA